MVVVGGGVGVVTHVVDSTLAKMSCRLAKSGERKYSKFSLLGLDEKLARVISSMNWVIPIAYDRTPEFCRLLASGIACPSFRVGIPSVMMMAMLSASERSPLWPKT